MAKEKVTVKAMMPREKVTPEMLMGNKKFVIEPMSMATEMTPPNVAATGICLGPGFAK